MSEFFSVFYRVIAPIFLIAGLGYLADRRFTFNTRSLSQLVIYLASPALVFSGLSQSTLDGGEPSRLFLFTMSVMALLAIVGSVLARLLNLSQRQSSAFALSLMLINAGNYGIPFITFAFGKEAIGHAIIIFAATSIMSNTAGVFLASRGSASVGRSVRNIFRVPLPYAVVMGLLVNQGVVTPPLPVARGLDLLGEAAVPLMLLLLGMQLARADWGNQIRLVALAAIIKASLPPMIGLLLARLLQLPPELAAIAVMHVSMPTAVIAIILAEEFGSDTKFVSGVVALSTLLSFVSLSILLPLIS